MRPSLSSSFPESSAVARLTTMVQDLEAGPTTSVIAFGDRLAEAVERKRSQLLVGLDPMPELLPVELAGEAGLGRAEAADACARFCRGVIDAVAAVRGRREAAARLLRGARPARDARRSRTSAPTRARPA